MARVFTFIKALVKYIRHGKNVDILTQNIRLEQCNKCIHNKMNTCELCGCVITTKIKWSTEACPLEKW